VIQDKGAFFMLTASLVGYAASEIHNYCRYDRTRWVSPVVLASVILFVLPFGLTNILYVLPMSGSRLLHGGSVGFDYLGRAQALAVVGVAAMWIGYRSGIGPQLAATFRSSRLLDRATRTSFVPYMPVLLAGMAVSVLSRLALVRMGLFGYSTEADQVLATAGVAQWVRTGSGLGSLALALTALAYYGTRRRHIGVVLSIWLVHEVAWGVLAAFKWSVLLPFVIVGLCRFMVERRVPRMYALAAIAVIVPAYAVVEPLRYLRFADVQHDTRSVGAIADAAVGVARGTDERAARFQQQVSLPILVASRLHLTTFAAHALEFNDRGPLPPDSPPFLRNVLLSPFYAVVPRALLPSKASATTGVWFSTTVLGLSARTSVGMSPVAYLYLAGGVVAVVLGFFVLGVLQRFSFDWLLRPRAGALLVYLVALAVTANVDPSEFWAVFTSYIRYIPLAFVAQAMAFRR